MKIELYVDRTVIPVYPGQMRRILHKEFERAGPATFEPSALEHYFHPGRIVKPVRRKRIYSHLVRTGILEFCLNLQDLGAVRIQGGALFFHCLGDVTLCAWKSVAEFNSGSLAVPCITKTDSEARISWVSLDDEVNVTRPIHIFPEQPNHDDIPSSSGIVGAKYA